MTKGTGNVNLLVMGVGERGLIKGALNWRSVLYSRRIKVVAPWRLLGLFERFQGRNELLGSVAKHRISMISMKSKLWSVGWKFGAARIRWEYWGIRM